MKEFTDCVEILSVTMRFGDTVCGKGNKGRMGKRPTTAPAELHPRKYCHKNLEYKAHRLVTDTRQRHVFTKKHKGFIEIIKITK